MVAPVATRHRSLAANSANTANMKRTCCEETKKLAEFALFAGCRSICNGEFEIINGRGVHKGFEVS